MTDKRCGNIIRSEILCSKPYQTINKEGFIKLDSMENPYPWPDKIKDKCLLYLKNIEFNRYPDPKATDLKKNLADLFLIPPSLSMLLGNGSDEIIQIILMSLKPSSVVLAPEPTFIMYKLLSKMLGFNFIGVPLKEDFSIDVATMLMEIEKKCPSVIFIASPNNPTGITVDENELESIIAAAPGLVVIDEAYYVFSKNNMLHKIENNSNVLLMRTLSKFGLASLRLGFLIGAKEWLNEFEKIRLPYNIGTLNQITTNFISTNADFLYKQAGKIRNNRDIIYNKLRNMKNIKVWNSDANFILFRVSDANYVYKKLLSRKILIKNLHGTHFLLNNCLRVTVGNNDENNFFLQALEEIIS